MAFPDAMPVRAVPNSPPLPPAACLAQDGRRRFYLCCSIALAFSTSSGRTTTYAGMVPMG